MATYLPLLVRQDTWLNEDVPEASGTILQLDSKPELRDVHGRAVVSDARGIDDLTSTHSSWINQFVSFTRVRRRMIKLRR